MTRVSLRGMQLGIPTLGDEIGSTHYVNTSTGNNSNDGLTPASAVQTLEAAITKWVAAGRRGTVRITASEAAPLRAPTILTDLASGDLVIRGNSGAWYSINGYNRNTGWTDTGGGVYSRAGITSYEGFVSIPDPIYGDYTYLPYDGATTTPAEGKIGVVSGVVYVHLPGAANPNTVTDLRLQLFSRTYQVPIASTATITIRDMLHSFGSSEGATQPLGGTMILRDCVFSYSCAIEVKNDAIGRCYNVKAYRALNDGFDARDTARLELYNCEGYYNMDEGVSPHNNSTLLISGGRYHHNARAGCTAINASVIDISNATFDYNGTVPPGTGIEQGHGLAAANTVSGSVRDSVFANNNASGIYNITSPSTLTFTNITSGLAAGNADADVGV